MASENGTNRLNGDDDRDPYGWIEPRLHRLRDQGLYRQLYERTSQGTTFSETDGRPLVNFGSNDYLGIASRPLSLPELPSGSGASPLISGHTSFHAKLCRELADWEGTESALLFPSGFAACCGTISALTERGDLILSDAFNHASLIDGCRLSKAERFRYPHLDADAVDALLRHHRHLYQRAWIITDSVFSMDGDVAPLSELVAIAARWDAALIVDEAHATGVLGARGSGACEAAGVKERVAVRIGTLSKAIGAQGGFVVGPEKVTQYLTNTARPLIYSTAASPLTITAALTAVRLIRQHPEHRRRVVALARKVRKRLGSLDPRMTISDIPIVPLRIGDAEAAVAASRQLAGEGFYVPAIRPPTVPPHTARLRISLSAAHRDDQVDGLLDAIERIVPRAPVVRKERKS